MKCPYRIITETRENLSAFYIENPYQGKAFFEGVRKEVYEIENFSECHKENCPFYNVESTYETCMRVEKELE